MELHLLRHAEAVDRRGKQDDPNRALTPSGRRRMKAIARGLKWLGLTPEIVVSSPYLRARETAEIAAATLGCREPLIFTPHLVPEAEPGAVVEFLRQHYRRAKSLLLVGHEPQLGLLAGRLIAGDAGAGMKLKKAGLVNLRVGELKAGRCATLEALIPPRVLEKLG
ncbi:MAG: SixA phosphatase family protein [Limisphaerales bacterium]